jgi:flavin-dependent dehydrogenase
MILLRWLPGAAFTHFVHRFPVHGDEGMHNLELSDGSRIGVIGGGPAGSFFAHSILTFAQRLGLDLTVEVYEPRDFMIPGPGGCNMCGGIVSETLVQALALEGITLPDDIVQRGIDSYVLHTLEDRIKIDTPLKEKRIAAIHRGGGPRDLRKARWGGLDGFLLRRAEDLGAQVIRTRVTDVDWQNGRPEIRFRGESRSYDLLVGATGVNSSSWKLYEKLGLRSKAPRTTKTYITELNLGLETISSTFGSSMHIFLLDIPRLDCAAIIPKGDYLTVCLLGQDVDRDLIRTFFESPAVQRFFPNGQKLAAGTCHCSPRINEREATNPYMDRVVLVGDCGATRLYKDGIGAAYRTAKAAARTAVFCGVSAHDFRTHYRPVYRSIVRDNRYGRFIFAAVHWIKAFAPTLNGVLRMTAREQTSFAAARRMSIVLWDMFTGSAPYADTFFRTMDPRFLGELFWQSALSAGKKGLVRERRFQS